MPYTYFLLNKITGEKYYGVRYAKDCSPEELWNTYFTSSKYVKQRIHQHGKESFYFEVRKIFETPVAARNWEERVLRKLNILQNSIWLNKNVCGKFLKEGPQTQEHIDKRVKKGLDTKLRNNNLHTPRWTATSHPEYALRVSQALKGKPKSADHIESMKKRYQNTASITCPHCGKFGDYKNLHRWHMDKCKHNNQSQRPE